MFGDSRRRPSPEPRRANGGVFFVADPLFATWGSNPQAGLPNSRMSETQLRARLYLHAEALQTEIDGVRSAALFFSRLAKEHDDENLAIAASGLLTLHGRLSDRFGGLVAVLRTASNSEFGCGPETAAGAFLCLIAILTLPPDMHPVDPNAGDVGQCGKFLVAGQ